MDVPPLVRLGLGHGEAITSAPPEDAAPCPAGNPPAGSTLPPNEACTNSLTSRVPERVAFSVHMRCDGTPAGNSVHITQQDVDNGLRSPIRVTNLREGPVWALFDYALDSPHRLLDEIDSDTIDRAWVTEEGSPDVYNARLTERRVPDDGGLTLYGVELEHPRKPGRYVPLKQKKGDKITTLTIEYRKSS